MVHRKSFAYLVFKVGHKILYKTQLLLCEKYAQKKRKYTTFLSVKKRKSQTGHSGKCM
jgi:hypothetical protein